MKYVYIYTCSIHVHVQSTLTDLLSLTRLPEFGTLAEGIAENCVLNILKEAISGDLNITAPLYLVAAGRGTNAAGVAAGPPS